MIEQPRFKLSIKGKDVTKDIEKYVSSLTYVDYNHGQSDEIQFEVEDTDGKWRSSWYPEIGVVMELDIEIGNKLRSCGTFELDELEYSSPPDRMVVKGLASQIEKKLRQDNTVAYEKTSLRAIAKVIAKKHNLDLSGNIKDIGFERITQNKESDLAFLKALAEDYGHVIKIYRDKLVFYNLKELESRPAQYDLERKQITSIVFRDKTEETFREANQEYHDIRKVETLIGETETEKKTKADRRKIKKRVENIIQAKEKAESELYRLNRKKVTADVEIYGDPYMVAGININLTGWSHFDGKYHIETSEHSITKSSGYNTTLSLIQV